jgi:hypothetical protein
MVIDHPAQVVQTPPSDGGGRAAAGAIAESARALMRNLCAAPRLLYPKKGRFAAGARVNPIELSKSRSIPPSREPDHSHPSQGAHTTVSDGGDALELGRWQSQRLRSRGFRAQGLTSGKRAHWHRIHLRGSGSSLRPMGAARHTRRTLGTARHTRGA